MDDKTTAVGAGFWRRLLAFFIDSLLLGLLGFGAGYLAYDLLASLTGPTRLIGLAVSLLYFGHLSSGPGGGRTLGMRVMGLKVVSMGGRPLGLVTAFWRALWLQAPIMLNGMYVEINDPTLGLIVGVALITLVFGVGLAQIILLLFNRPSRRLVHDLLSGAIVVRNDARDVRARSSRTAVTIAVLTILLAAGGGLAMAKFGSRFMPRVVTDLLPAQAAVASIPGVMSATVQDNTTTVHGTGGSRTTRTLVVTARVAAWPRDKAAMMDQIGAAAVGAYRLKPGQRVRVVLTRGYDIGIASAWRSESDDYLPKAPAPPAAAVADA